MLNNPEQLWNRCLSVIKDNISEASYNTWFAPIVALKYEENVFVLQVPSQFFVEYIEDFISQKVLVSPLAWSLAYQYPVHEISPEFLPTEPPAQATYLIVYRGWDDEVHFIQISPITFRLLQIIEENPEFTVEACLKQLADEAKHPEPEVIVSGGLEILEKLFGKSIIAIH